jgi:tetratricopeptide (TPR) repeat protein
MRKYTLFRREGRKLESEVLAVIRACRLSALLVAATVLAIGLGATAAAAQPSPDAQTAFYTARFEDAAALTVEACAAGDLEACELRSSALLFELKRVLDPARNKDQALTKCGKCPALVEAFLADTARGQSIAREILNDNATDENALFFLGKLDLNYVWLQAGTLGRKTGWDQYWEARRALDAVLKMNPHHVRAKVARAWIDYIVDTRIPWAARWAFGGGSRKKALATLREAAAADADRFDRAEARFGLWDMLAREKNYAEAVVVARQLAQDFPANTDLPRFLSTHDPYFKAGE